MLVVATLIEPASLLLAAPPAATVTFSKDIAPIMLRSCIECHRKGGSGPFPFETYEQVRSHSRQIVEVTADRYMPPWKPDPEVTPPLEASRGLSEADIALLRTWQTSGCAPGDLADVPSLPAAPDGWVLGEPDLIVELGEAYTLAAQGQDIYRNFVLTTDLPGPRYIRAVELLPGTRLAIHHSLLLVDHSDSSRRRDDAEPGPGFGGMFPGRAGHPDGHFVGWTPGQRPFEAFPGTAWLLRPGDDLVLQLHMIPTGKPETIRPRIGLYFADHAPARKTFVIQMRELAIDIPAGAEDYRVQAEFTLPSAVEALGLYPHAHYLGKDLRVYAELPDGGRQWLIRIPDWDFNWQMDYRFVQPIPLPAGAVITMDYRYDNSRGNPRNPSDPPIRVRGGSRSVDEMAEVAIQVLIDDERERAGLIEETLRRRFESDGLALTSYIRGRSHEEDGATELAREAYTLALQADPGFAPALTQLGTIAFARGQRTEGLEFFTRAHAAQSDSPETVWNLARARYDLGDRLGAQPLLARLLEFSPQHHQGRILLALFHAEEGRLPEAVDLLTAGLSWHGDDPAYRLQTAKLLLAGGRTAEAAAQLRLAGKLSSSTSRETTAGIAYLLAVISHRAHQPAATLRHLERAEAADPTHIPSRLLHASLLLTSGNTPRAREIMDALARMNPHSLPAAPRLVASLPFPHGSLQLAEALQRAGRIQSARLVLVAALEKAQRDSLREAVDIIRATLARLPPE